MGGQSSAFLNKISCPGPNRKKGLMFMDNQKKEPPPVPQFHTLQKQHLLLQC